MQRIVVPAEASPLKRAFEIRYEQGSEFVEFDGQKIALDYLVCWLVDVPRDRWFRPGVTHVEKAERPGEVAEG